MKTILRTTAALAALLYAGAAFADDKKGHDHDHDHGHHHHDGIITGPNGGRVLTDVEPHLEFFITGDKKVKISAVSADDKPKVIALGDQSVKVIAGKRLSPTRLAFTKDGNSLISDKALPKGLDIPVVVQIKTTADSKTALARFQANLRDCPTCDFKEYACACDHHHDHDHDDEKKKN